MLRAIELMIGSKFLGIAGIQTVKTILDFKDRGDWNGQPAQDGYEHLILVHENRNQYKPCEIEGIPVTPEIIDRCPDFKKHPAPSIIGDSYIMDIGRQRRIVVSNVDNGNQMITLQEYDHKDYRKTTDIVVLWNFDYDGRVMVHKFQQIVFCLTGEHLKIEDL